MPHTRHTVLLAISVALIVAACGGGDNDDRSPSDSGGATQSAVGGSYGEQLTAIDEAIDQQFEVLSNEFESLTDDALSGLDGITDAAELQDALEQGFADIFAAALDFVPRAIDIIENGVARIEALDTPDRFEDDQQAFLDAIGQRTDLLRQLEDVAQDEDIEAFFAFGQSTARDDIDNALRAAISDDFRVFISAFLDDDEVEIDDEDDGGGASVTRDDDGDFTITSDEGSVSIDSDDGRLTVTDGEGTRSVTTGGDDDVPDELRYPNAIGASAITLEENDILRIVLTFTTSDDPNDILDFYEDAFADLGLRGDRQHGEIGGLHSLTVGDAQRDGGGVIVAENAGQGADHGVSVVVVLPR